MSRTPTAAKKATPPRTVRAAAPAGSVAPKKRVRMNRAVRRENLIEQAVDYFSAHGLNAQVKDFAAAIGISEGLIFHYFGSRRNLMELVYRTAYKRAWPDERIAVLRDRGMPITERIERFYLDFLSEHDRFEWVFGVAAASISDPEHRRRFAHAHIEQFMNVLFEEIRAAYDLPPKKMTEMDRELMWHLHSTISCYLVRKHVAKAPVIKDKRLFIRRILSNFLAEFDCSCERAAA